MGLQRKQLPRMQGIRCSWYRKAWTKSWCGTSIIWRHFNLFRVSKLMCILSLSLPLSSSLFFRLFSSLFFFFLMRSSTHPRSVTLKANDNTLVCAFHDRVYAWDMMDDSSFMTRRVVCEYPYVMSLSLEQRYLHHHYAPRTARHALGSAAPRRTTQHHAAPHRTTEP